MVEEMIIEINRYLQRPAMNAAIDANFHLDQAETNLYFAATALRSKETRVGINMTTIL